MAELTSGLTSAVFSPYSKMFIGGLSWQTSPGETVLPFPAVSRHFCLFCRRGFEKLAAAAAAGGVSEDVHRAVVNRAGYLRWRVRAVLFLIFVHLKSSIRPLCASRGVFKKKINKKITH